MPDNLNSAYLASRKTRSQPQMDSMLAELDALSQAPAAAPTGPSTAPASPKKDTSPSYIAEGLKAVGGGVVDAARNAWNAVDDAATWLDNNFLDLRINSSSFGKVGGAAEAHKADLQAPALPSWAQNETTGGNIARAATQFVVPFLGATKALKAAGMATAAVRGAAAGAATDFAAFDPHQQRLSNLVMDFSNGNPAIGKPLFEYLAADPSDSNMEGRFKNTLEGLGLGLAMEGIFKGAKAVKAHFTAKGENPAEALSADAKKAPEDNTAHAIDTTPEPDMALADQIEAITGVRGRTAGADRWQKRLDVQAAVKEDALQGPQKPVAEAPAEVPLPERWKQAEQEAAAGTARQAYWEPAESSIVFTKDKPTPTQLPLDQRIKALEGKQGFELTPEEMIVARAYRQLQDKALEAFRGATKDPAETPASTLIVEPKVGSGPRVASAETPVEAPAASVETPSAPLEARALDERINAAQARVDALEAEGKGTETAQRVLDSLLKKKDEALRDHSTKLSGKQADTLANGKDPIVDEIAAKDAELSARFGRKQQGGFISPSMLANLLSMQGGAVAGFTSAGDDASIAERLSLAGVGGLAGLGIKVGASKVLSHAHRALRDNPSPEVAAMARPEVANIAPLAATTKKLPVIHTAKVNKLVEAAKEGGFEALSRAVKEQDFNFARIDTQEDVKSTIDAFSAVFEKETSLAKHGKQSFGDIQELADELGAGVTSLKELYHGTENLGARILAHRALLTASAEQVTKLSRLAMQGDAEGILALRKQVALHASIQAQMKGVQTEVARALAQFRINSSSIDLAINERSQLIEAMGGHAANIKFARQLADITDPKKLNAVIRKSAMARTKDALYEAWINGLLSSPTTHAVNAVGNTLVAIGSAAERGTAALIGKVLRTGPEAVQGGEAKAYLFGMVEGAKDALSITAEGLKALQRAGGEALTGNFAGAREAISSNADEFGNAYKAFAADMPILDNAAYGTREFDLQAAAISADRFGMDPNGVLGRFADGLGALVRTPGRMLTTSDEVFKTLHYRGELKAQAYRQGVSEGLTGDALFSRIAGLVDEPTPELSAQALTAAREGTFTSPLGKSGGSLQQFIANTPGARYVMPFVRTPINIMKYVGTRTPGLNLLSSNVRAEFAAGGARRDIMLAKTATGIGLYTLGATLAAQGIIVGGGEKDKSAEKLGGALPYSVKVGDTYYAFNRMDPFGMFLGLAADFSDISGHVDQQTADDIASALLLSISKNLVSKSYLSGLVNLIEAFSNPETKGDSYVQNAVASFVPAISNTVRKEEDPLVREVWSVMDAVKNRIPGFSKDLPAQLNAFGEEVSYKGGLGPDIASPVMTSQESSDPAAREIARLNVDLKMPSKTLGGGNGAPGIDLTPQQYHRLVKIMGSEVGRGGFKGAMDELLSNPQYQALPEDPSNSTYMEAKEKVIRDTFETHKRAATWQLLQEDGELMSKFNQNKQNAGNALTGAPILPF